MAHALTHFPQVSSHLAHALNFSQVRWRMHSKSERRRHLTWLLGQNAFFINNSSVSLSFFTLSHILFSFSLCSLHHDISHDFHQRWVRSFLVHQTSNKNEILAHSFYGASQERVEVMARERHRRWGTNQKDPEKKNNHLTCNWKTSILIGGSQNRHKRNSDDA